MPDTSSPTWVGAISALSGVVVGLLSPLVTATLMKKRERESRIETRRDSAREKQNEFQRETLLSLQETSQALIRTAYPPKLAAVSADRFLRVTKLKVRVTDDFIRRICGELQQQYDEFLQSADAFVQTNSVNVMFEIYNRLNDAIGERLRTLNDEDRYA